MASNDDGSSMFSGAAFLGAMSVTAASKLLGPAIKAKLGVDLNVLITLFILATMVFAGWGHVDDFIHDMLARYYSCTIRITSEDSMFGAVMDYLDEQGVFETRDPVEDSICGASKAWYSRPVRNLDGRIDPWNSDLWGDSDSKDDDSDDENNADGSTPYLKTRKIKYSPAPSYISYFHFKPTGHTIAVLRTERTSSASAWWQRQKEFLELSAYGRDMTPLKMLLQQVCDRENTKDVGRTTVFKATPPGSEDGASWARCFSRASRPISTVVLDGIQKDRICQDIREYLMPATRKWYANRGLPYRRGYLLYGPPGTGKSSLTVALAGKYGLRVYSLSLSAAWMNDDTLAHLFSRLPKSCIVLLEDIDACGVTRESGSTQQNNDNAGQNSRTNPQNATSTGARVSFSGLLNAIDGVASKEGRLLIMTTNHHNRLDEALIRPGRVDLQIEFYYADKTTVYNLFQALYAVDDSEKDMLEFPRDFPDKEEIEKLATRFAEQIPGGEFSPAEVQGLLLRHKKEPRKAVEGVEEWVAQAREEKMQRDKKEKERIEGEKREQAKEAEETKKAEEAKSEKKEEKAENPLGTDVKPVGVPASDSGESDQP